MRVHSTLQAVERPAYSGMKRAWPVGKSAYPALQALEQDGAFSPPGPPPPARLPPHTAPAGHSRTAVKIPDTRRPEGGRLERHVAVVVFRLPGTRGSCAPARFLAVCLSASCRHLHAVAQPSEVGRWWDAGAAV